MKMPEITIFVKKYCTECLHKH